jgi:uncharacterized protein (TIGR03000 family)
MMLRRTRMFLMLPLLAAGILALAALPAEGRPRGGARGGGGRAFVGPRGGVVVGGGRGRVFIGPRGGVGVRVGGFRANGLGLGLGYGGYGGLGYGGSGDYGASGGYGSGGYMPYQPNYSGYASPGAVESAVPSSGAPSLMEDAGPSQTDNLAHLMVVVPENATVWFEGEKMSQTGATREFVSPPLTPGKRFTYTVRVRFTNDDNKVVDETRKIYVRAGNRWRVDFTKPAPRVADPLPVPREAD